MSDLATITEHAERMATLAVVTGDGPEISETWAIDGDRTAAWALRKIRAAEQEQARLKDLYDDEIARLQQGRTESLTQPQRTIDFFKSKLIDYRRTLEDANPELPQTYKLPGGRISRRVGAVKVDVADPDTFVTWALDNAAELVRVEPARSELGKLPKADDGSVISADGEPIPGVGWVRGDDIYDVKVDG